VDLPGCDIQVDSVERDDITEQFREPAGPHGAETADNSSSSHTENLQDAPNLCVDSRLKSGKCYVS
jgi:hypothetical protein